ncbi:uncharacterized protein LOC111070664 [Drosophila obscura]|uniref:uncharacterized protein LOC111070664 n=1 Tax=Drosophila obscura TaxID=7282 RepID=UPI001BB0ECBC|nr:uncharacterized protein LOC111070664 [Drosophila obscura]
MSKMPNRSKPTMTGVFPAPRSTPGRNFLNENKVSLRSLEKTTTEKLAAKEPVRPKWMPPMRRADSEVGESKAAGRPQPLSVSRQNTRESSLTRNRNNSCSHQQLGLGAAESGQRVGRSTQRNPVHYDASEEAAQSSEYCSSCGTQRSSSSIATQTEDISDELYLTNALKKCSFDGASVMSERESPNKYENNNYKRANRYDNNDNDENLLSPRTHGKQQQPQHLNDDQKMENSRDDVRLPRFLEKDKEKREKAAAKELADASDPDCMLTEQARVGHLNSAQKRYDGLINELNHMPITSQSLWVRNRKAEIDKELAVVDEEIRVYSKSKLYINSSKNK